MGFTSISYCFCFRSQNIRERENWSEDTTQAKTVFISYCKYRHTYSDFVLIVMVQREMRIANEDSVLHEAKAEL